MESVNWQRESPGFYVLIYRWVALAAFAVLLALFAWSSGLLALLVFSPALLALGLLCALPAVLIRRLDSVSLCADAGTFELRSGGETRTITASDLMWANFFNSEFGLYIRDSSGSLLRRRFYVIGLYDSRVVSFAQALIDQRITVRAFIGLDQYGADFDLERHKARNRL